MRGREREPGAAEPVPKLTICNITRPWPKLARSMRRRPLTSKTLSYKLLDTRTGSNQEIHSFAARSSEATPFQNSESSVSIWRTFKSCCLSSAYHGEFNTSVGWLSHSGFFPGVPVFKVSVLNAQWDRFREVTGRISRDARRIDVLRFLQN